MQDTGSRAHTHHVVLFAGTLFFYTALLQGLEPNTRYYYQIDGGSTVASFVTARLAGDATPFNVLIVGDMGLDNSANTMAQMLHMLPNVDFFSHIGDLSYADDFYLRKNDTYEGSWNKWQDLMEPITSVAPYMTLPGNHEVTCMEVTPFLCPPHQRNMTAYRQRFRMPSVESGGVQNLWYSYDYGLVHFIQVRLLIFFFDRHSRAQFHRLHASFGELPEMLSRR